jgi:hypothetical protein
MIWADWKRKRDYIPFQSQPRHLMKSQSAFIIVGAVSLMLGASWFSEVLAQPRNETQITPDKKSDYPIGRRCVVTLDPQHPKPVVVGEANVVTGFTAPDTVTGILAVWNDDWVAVRDGTNENWMRAEKVIMIHIAEKAGD